jgi:hypothetical protein
MQETGFQNGEEDLEWEKIGEAILAPRIMRPEDPEDEGTEPSQC